MKHRDRAVHQSPSLNSKRAFCDIVGASRAVPTNTRCNRSSGKNPKPNRGVEKSMSYEQALRSASRDERFMATVYAMNSLLIHKGIYTHEEFQQLFTEWVRKEEAKKAEAVTAMPRHAFAR